MGKSRGLKVWEAARALAERVGIITKDLPRSSPAGLRRQLAEAALSVPSNIAEGAGRGTPADTLHYFHMARASLEEVQNDLRICVNSSLIDRATFFSVWNRSVVVSRMLAKLIARLEAG